MPDLKFTSEDRDTLIKYLVAQPFNIVEPVIRFLSALKDVEVEKVGEGTPKDTKPLKTKKNEV
jgi:hypothetical protein